MSRTRLGSGALSLAVAMALLLAGCTSDGPSESGGKLGEPVPTMSIAYYASDFNPSYEAEARILVENFADIGFQVELEPIDFSTFVDQITVGHQLEEMALGSFGGDPDRLDPNFWLIAMGSCEGSHNPTNWCDPEYDAIVEEQSKTLDEEARVELIFQAEEYFQSQAPYWQIGHVVQGMIYNSDRWENVIGSVPLSPHENTLDPWLSIIPTGDDRILDWAHIEDVSSYNYMVEPASAGWLRFVYDPYLAMDEGKLVPWAATEWEFVDDTTLELTLRDGMTFHDGEAVTAEDAVYSINLMVELQPPPIADVLATIESAEQVDELTFRLNLTQPNPGVFRQVLTDLVILPKHVLETIDDPLTWDPVEEGNVIGSGPFKFESWDVNQQHVLSTNTDHWAAPAYDGIRRLSLGSADGIRSTLVDGTADIATQSLPASAMESLANENESLSFVEYPSLSTQVLWMNLEVPPFDDLEFRKALRLATDRERATVEGWIGFGLPAGPGNVPRLLEEWVSPDLETIPYDVGQARQVLTDAGYGWDEEGNLHFPTS